MFIVVDPTNNRVLQFYTQELAPAGSIEITDEQHADILTKWPDVAFVDGQVKELDYATYVTFDIARQRKMIENNTIYETAFAKTKVDTPPSEADTWTKQEYEARNWLANKALATPMIDAMATMRGMDREVLLEKVIAKADAFSAYIGAITGLRQRYEDQILAATTVEELARITLDYTL